MNTIKLNGIEDLIDHYEPYREVLDTVEAKEVRKVLSKFGTSKKR